MEWGWPVYFFFENQIRNGIRYTVYGMDDTDILRMTYILDWEGRGERNRLGGGCTLTQPDLGILYSHYQFITIKYTYTTWYE
jgi:hypothetical protein